MDLGRKLLSDVTVFSKYSRYMPEKQRRETWHELCYRNRNMHLDMYPHLKNEIISVYENFVIPKKVLPAMRSLQFSGKPIMLNPARQYNCTFAAVDDYRVFSETMFLLLGGSGVGYSVQNTHIKKLPVLRYPLEKKRYVVGDSIEGWAEAVRMLAKAFFAGGWLPIFDFSDIRPKGALLVTAGGKAPGPKPLKICLEKIQSILYSIPDGKRINSLQIHDIQCFIADAVLTGGIRRAAMISLFDIDDELMLKAKSGDWWIDNPQRARANNSAVIIRHKVKQADFLDLWKIVEDSQAGEPGILFSNTPHMGANPCLELSLKSQGACNLSEINMATIESEEDYIARAKVASFLGTLQAGYTHFHYLRKEWQETIEKEALIGVSGTGIAAQSVLRYDHAKAAEAVKAENKRVAKLIGIRSAARTTCVKPAGTTSCVLGSSSGIHAWYDNYYIRRMRIGKNESIYRYLKDNHSHMLEDDVEKPDIQSIISFPIKAPDDAITRHENVFNFLDRIALFSTQWIRKGHIKGDNTNNVSATVSIKDNEWEPVGKWMWENRDIYNGLSVLPYDGGTYRQTPFESISEETYKKMYSQLKPMDLKDVSEITDNTDLTGELACAGGKCEVV